MTTKSPRQLELLAPARDLATAREAILHGADAVYIGAPSHGARSKAVNSIDDIAELVRFATPYGVKVYVTVNTIIYDDELDDVAAMVRRLYQIGVDALIVQDMALLEMDLPPIAMHASTQCDTRTPEKARFLADAGFSQIVVARELDLPTLAAICRAVDVPVEAFVHGALCVSYSGDCRASLLATGRSANRGCCAQMCRLPYDLRDGNGSLIGRGHYLSLRDMNRISSLAEMAEAGVSSFKIEGRMKDAAYVKDVTAAYRRALDRLIEANPEKYCRASRGVSTYSFEPSLEKCFNRGYTDYFLHGSNKAPISTPLSPKALGEIVGEVVSAHGRTIVARLNSALNNGDGLTWERRTGEAGGGLLNRVDDTTPRGSGAKFGGGDKTLRGGGTVRLLMASEVDARPGSPIRRSHDRLREEAMLKPTATRLIPIDITLRRAAARLVLEGTIDGVGTVAVTTEAQLRPASNPDNGYRKATLSKLGGTIFAMRGYTDEIPQMFVPASVLSALRRDLVEMLVQTLIARKHRELRRGAPLKAKLAEGAVLTERDNVANRLARQFYRKAGAEKIVDAWEVKAPKRDSDLLVMNTRYCLRRELGACLKEGGARRLAGPLTLQGADFTYRLDFDCANCRMNVFLQNQEGRRR